MEHATEHTKPFSIGMGKTANRLTIRLTDSQSHYSAIAVPMHRRPTGCNISLFTQPLPRDNLCRGRISVCQQPARPSPRPSSAYPLSLYGYEAAMASQDSSARQIRLSDTFYLFCPIFSDRIGGLSDMSVKSWPTMHTHHDECSEWRHTVASRDRLGVAVGIWGYNLRGTSPLQSKEPKERSKENSKMK